MTMHSPLILVAPSRDIETQSQVLGLSLTERAALTVARYYGAEEVFAPHLPAGCGAGGVRIVNAVPAAIERPVVLVDPLLLFDARLLRNLTVNFAPPVVACDPATLEPIGLARLLPEHLSWQSDEPLWAQVRAFLLRRQDARVAVVSAPYFTIRQAADIARAEQFLLRSAVHKGDDIVERTLVRPLSRFVTSWTANLRIDPNVWTFVVAVLGIAATLLLFLPGFAGGGWSALLLAAAAILSAVDGETARLTFRTSRLGGMFNYYTSRGIVWLFFLGLTLSARESLPSLIGGIVFLVVYPMLVVRYDRFRHGKEKDLSLVRRIERTLRRHFSVHTVTVVALAASGAGLFRETTLAALPLCALGSLVVLAGAFIRRMERRRTG